MLLITSTIQHTHVYIKGRDIFILSVCVLHLKLITYVTECVCTRYLYTFDVILQFNNLAIYVHILTCIKIDSNYVHIYIYVYIFIYIKVLFHRNTTVAYNHQHPSMTTCFGLFQTIFRPIFSSRRQSRCALYIMGSHTVYRVCVKTVIKVFNFKTPLNRMQYI